MCGCRRDGWLQCRVVPTSTTLNTGLRACFLAQIPRLNSAVKESRWICRILCDAEGWFWSGGVRLSGNTKYRVLAPFDGAFHSCHGFTRFSSSRATSTGDVTNSASTVGRFQFSLMPSPLLGITRLPLRQKQRFNLRGLGCTIDLSSHGNAGLLTACRAGGTCGERQAPEACTA